MHVKESINLGLISRVLEKLNRSEKTTLNKKGESYSQKKEISELSLEEFKARNIAIRIKSDVLNGEEFYLVSNEEMADNIKGEGLAYYFPDEISALRGKSPEMIRTIHKTKKIFLGSKIIG